MNKLFALFMVFVLPFSVGLASASGISFSNVSITNTSIDLGQSTFITVNGVSGGTGPYHAYWFFSSTNASTPSTTPFVANSYSSANGNYFTLGIQSNSTILTRIFLFYNALSPSQNITVANESLRHAFGKWQFNIFIKGEFNTPNVTAKAGTIYINPPLSKPVIISPSSAYYIDLGQSTEIVAKVTGGTPPYTYSWNAIGDCPGLKAPGNVSSFTYHPNATTNNCRFVVSVKDSATTPETATSSPSQVINVNPALSTPVITSPASAAEVAIGKSINVSAQVTGGTPPYSYSWTPVSSFSCPGFVSPGSFSSFIYTPTVPMSGCQFQVIVSDSASNPVTMTSAPSPEISANNTVTVTAPTTTVPAKVITHIINITTPSGSKLVNISISSPALFNYESLGAKIGISTHAAAVSPVKVIVSSASPNVPAPKGFDMVKAININVSTNASIAINTTISYNCSIPSSKIAPYLLSNSTWSAIRPFTVNATSCTVTFAVPNDPTVAIMENATPTTTVSTTVNTTTTINTTTVATTVLPAPSNKTTVPTTLSTTPPTSVPTTVSVSTTPPTSAPSGISGIEIAAIVVIIIIIVAVALYLMKSKKSSSGAPEQKG